MSSLTPNLYFYFNRNCPYAQRSWLTLLELGVDYEPVEIELGKDNKTEWYRSMNPNGTVPTIKHGKAIIYESLVVNEYLCEVFGNRATLMPSDSAARAQLRILISRCDNKFVKLVYNYLSHKRDNDSTKDEQLRTQLVEELHFLDQAIGSTEGRYFFGEKLSLVDLTYIPFFERQLVALPTWKNFEIRSLGLSKINTWLDTMSSQESYLKTRTEPERIKELYSHFLGGNYFKKVGVAE